MVHAGAVRAMELDINSYWPASSPIALRAQSSRPTCLPDMVRSPFRYLTPDDRDFFAVYVKGPTNSKPNVPLTRR